MAASLLCIYAVTLILTIQKVIGEETSSNQIDKMDISSRLNEFSFDLYKEITKATNGNILFSPFSIFTGFTMLGIGARGRTKNELSTSLKWGKLEELVEKLKPLYKEMSRRNAGDTRLMIANKLWVSNDIKILKSYRRTIAYFFQSKIGKKSFSSSPETARKSINNWIAQRTNKNIKDMFPVRSIDSMTRLVLGNAIYFKGNWEKPFDIKETKTGKFYLANGKHVNVDYMSTEDKFPAYFDERRNVQLVEIPYSGNKFSMIVVLPEIPNINEVERAIDANIMREWIQTLTVRDTNWSSKTIYVPKFKIRQSLALSKLLQSLSIHDLFQSSKADLSGISGQKALHCSNALHKSYIEIDEEGTISSAATGIGITMLSYPMTIRLERPFLFYIIHKTSQIIIFSGKVMNPLQSDTHITEKDINIKNKNITEETVVNLIKDVSEKDVSSRSSEEDKLIRSNSAEKYVQSIWSLFSPMLTIYLSQHLC